jgi:hypothetical protein
MFTPSKDKRQRLFDKRSRREIADVESSADAKYAPLTHGHGIEDVLGLQTALDSKEPASDKGSLIAGANVTLSGTLENRLVGSGDVTISASSGGGGGSSYIPGESAIAFSSPELNTNVLNAFGNHFSTGSYSAVPLAATSFVTRQPLIRIVSGGTTSTSISGIQTRARVSTGAKFSFAHVFSPDNNPMNAAHRLFIGLSTRTTFTDVNPSTLTNIIGIGYDSGDTQFQFMCNDGSGTATKVPLGAAFAKPTARANKLWRVRLDFDGTTLTYSLSDLGTGTTASGTTTTDLPANTVL